MKTQAMLSIPLFVSALLMLTADVTGAPSAPTNIAARVAALSEAARVAHRGDPDMQVRPGLVADRNAHEVHFFAEATGLGANEILEFLVIGLGGGHDYESFAVSHARALDIHEGLEFIGMAQGRGVRPSELAFWPKGERVIAHVALVDPPPGSVTNSVWQQAVRLESIVWNASKAAAMTASGFVFTGSQQVQLSERGTDPVYAADAQEPHAILSSYNEPTTVLDVPWQASKESVYASQRMRESHVLPKATLLKITLAPERLGGAPRVQDLTLKIAPRMSNARELADANFSLLDPAQALLMGPTNLPAVVKRFADIVKAEQDPFVTLKFTDDAPLGLVKNVSALLGQLEGESGIRIEPALPGQLYYRAFNPPEQNRARETRMSQPWELHLVQGSNGWETTLSNVEAIYTQGAAEPEFVVRDYPAATSSALRYHLDAALRAELSACLAKVSKDELRKDLEQRLEAFSAEELWAQAGETFFQEIQDALFDQEDYSALPEKVRRLRVILVYAEPDTTHGELMVLLKDAMTTHPTVHVYLPNE